MQRAMHLCLAATLAVLSGTAAADSRFPAVLEGHAVLPAMTLASPPADAPAWFKSSGRFAGRERRRLEDGEKVMGTSFLSDKAAPRPTGIEVPLAGQPAQGFSGIKKMGDGSYLVLTDNGFGSKANLADALLMFHRVRPDWRSGRTALEETRFLYDPDRKVPFLIINEATEKRYLTGADFDIESIQPIGEEIWFGDEFGPYLIRTDRAGRVLAVHQTKVDGKVIRSPDHHLSATPAVPSAVAFEVRRSRGYEGMAASPDGKLLYPLLEGPLWSAAQNGWETKDGKAPSTSSWRTTTTCRSPPAARSAAMTTTSSSCSACQNSCRRNSFWRRGRH